MKGVLRISRKGKDGQRLDFVSRAIGDIWRDFDVVKAENGTITAADGIRIHTVKIDENIEDGLYSIDITKDMVIMIVDEKKDRKYPDIEKLISEKTKGHHKLVNDKIEIMKSLMESSRAVGQIIHAAGMPIQLRVLKDIHGEAMYLYGAPDSKLIHFKSESGDRNAYIMVMESMD